MVQDVCLDAVGLSRGTVVAVFVLHVQQLNNSDHIGGDFLELAAKGDQMEVNIMSTAPDARS